MMRLLMALNSPGLLRHDEETDVGLLHHVQF